MLAAAGLALGQARAQDQPVQDQPAQEQPAPSGGVDAQVRIDDLVESYDRAPRSMAYLLRNISLGYEVTMSGRGVFDVPRTTLPRETVDQSITRQREPRGIIIDQGRDGQPILRFRFADTKVEIRVQGTFIRSTWEMLAQGRDVTIMAPVEPLTIVRRIAGQVGQGVSPLVRKQLSGTSTATIEDLTLRQTRTEGDKVIIQCDRGGLTISYPPIIATYDAPAKAVSAPQ
ncbi:MAG: hypothetical protein GC201_03140 [Alphaproteobacteria bacterium]|nr:hypothetical protein [Alphaproteobacteria bacterium]